MRISVRQARFTGRYPRFFEAWGFYACENPNCWLSFCRIR